MSFFLQNTSRTFLSLLKWHAWLSLIWPLQPWESHYPSPQQKGNANTEHVKVLQTLMFPGLCSHFSSCREYPIPHLPWQCPSDLSKKSTSHPRTLLRLPRLGKPPSECPWHLVLSPHLYCMEPSSAIYEPVPTPRFWAPYSRGHSWHIFFLPNIYTLPAPDISAEL